MTSARFDRWFEGFVRTGDISPLRLGQMRDEVLAALGEPDDVDAASSSSASARIFRYGPLELHFGAGPHAPLCLLHAEDEAGVVRVALGNWPPPRGG